MSAAMRQTTKIYMFHTPLWAFIVTPAPLWKTTTGNLSYWQHTPMPEGDFQEQKSTDGKAYEETSARA